MSTNLKDLKLIIADVDGVLTDGGMYYFEDGNEAKKFNTKDGMAVKLFRKEGIQVIFMTRESTQIVVDRANKLEVRLEDGIKDKSIEVLKILRELNISSQHVAYIGDDVNDIDALNMVGVAICPADAVGLVKNICHLRTNAKGGEGVLREVYELFLKQKLLKQKLIFQNTS